jgi:DNA polymerase I-like protein with 3'-5' exonuclease and polymerase domains
MPDNEYDSTLESLDDYFPELKKSAPVESVPAPDETPQEASTVVDLFAPAPPVPVPVEVETSGGTLADFMPSVSVATPEPVKVSKDDDEDDNIVLEIRHEREVPDITKPWMKYHKFTRVDSVEKVRQIVDAALKHGRCSLDTETEGLDVGMTFDALGKPKTNHQIVGYCISVDGVEGYYIPIRHTPEDGGTNFNLPVAEVDAEITRLCRAAQPKPAPGALEKDPLSFREFAEPPKVVIYFWYAKFDQEMLYPVTGIDWWHPESFEDGLLACFCHYSADKTLSLKHKAPDNLRDIENNPYKMIEMKELFIRGRPIKFNTLSPDEPGVLKYACSDAICTYLLCDPPREHEKDRKDYMALARERYAFTYRLEKQTIQATRVMERYRTMVDRDKAKELLDLHEKEFQRLLGEIQSFARAKGYLLDPSSPKQLSDFLFTDNQGCLNISPKPEINEASKQYKTDGETLEAMVVDNPHAPPILKWIVSYRGEEKIIGTYLEHLWKNPDKNNELRFSFKETGAGTGRFSAPAGDHDQGFSGIPIHGIPSESVMRKLFLAREGYTFVKCDYAAQELRIAANVSGETVWVKEFLEGDGDLHTITAKAFFNKETVSKDERKMGKIANFALIYGGGPQAIIRATGCDKVEASRRKQAFDKAVPIFAGWIKSQQKLVKKNEGVWTPFKRWLAIPDANIMRDGQPDRKVQAACERYAVNYPIQGSGADIMKISMVTLHKEFFKRGWLRTGGGDDSVRMLLTVHDEIVFEIKHDRVTEVVPIIVEIMERPGKLATPRWKVPLVVEPLVGANWGTGYKCDRLEERVQKAAREKKPFKLDEGEVIVNGFVYGVIREVDLGKESPSAGEEEHSRNDEKKKLKIRVLNPAWLRNVPTVSSDDVAGPHAAAAPGGSAPPLATPVPLAPVAIPVVPEVTFASPKPAAPSGRVVVLRIHRLTMETVGQVGKACYDAGDPEHGKLLKLTDQVGVPLIEPSLGIRVDPVKLAELLDKQYNIGDGRFTEEN